METPGLGVEVHGPWVLGVWAAPVWKNPLVELGSERWALSVLLVTVVASVALIG
jgi:hypothetical protein